MDWLIAISDVEQGRTLSLLLAQDKLAHWIATDARRKAFRLRRLGASAAAQHLTRRLGFDLHEDRLTLS